MFQQPSVLGEEVQKATNETNKQCTDHVRDQESRSSQNVQAPALVALGAEHEPTSFGLLGEPVVVEANKVYTLLQARRELRIEIRRLFLDFSLQCLGCWHLNYQRGYRWLL